MALMGQMLVDETTVVVVVAERADDVVAGGETTKVVRSDGLGMIVETRVRRGCPMLGMSLSSMA